MTPLEIQRYRSGLKSQIRSFFQQRDYLEVETPVIVVQPGTEVYIDYFQTKWRDFRGTDHRMYLRSSPELHMKQLLSAGAERIFQFAISFRNYGELARWHHPEFLMLEWYETNISFVDMIGQTEMLLRSCASFVTESCNPTVPYIFPQSIAKFTVAEAFQKFAGIKLIDGDPELAKKARAQGFHSVLPSDDFETAYFKILIDAIEPGLEACGVSVLYDYPKSQAALAVIEGDVAKRFEFYLGRIEICNGFLELASVPENEARIREANKKRLEIGKSPTMIDQDFLRAMGGGFPACCGNALGIDRLLAILLGHNDLDRIIPFRRGIPFINRPDMA
jgi:lysyl-tRNA synthetase class 2